jgi:malate synthase
MKEANQISRQRDDVQVTAKDLLTVPDGDITIEGLRWNIDVGLQYLESWLRGNGCVPIYNLMEDAATAEICRAQVWQWIEFGATLKDGRRVDDKLVEEVIGDQVIEMRRRLNTPRCDIGNFRVASAILETMMTGVEFPEFLTLVAYDYLD